MINRAGFVALVGLPNAGKSTLVNQLIGEKVGIVSRKPQTTRGRVVGILNSQDAQVCFVDSPGRVEATAGLNIFLEKELMSVMKDADALLCVLNLDAHKMETLLEVAELASAQKKPWAIVINKTDLDPGLREPKLRMSLAKYNVPISSGSAAKMTPRFREELTELSKNLCPEATEPLFEETMYTTQRTRDLAAEVVREQCFEYLHQEVPYGLAVKVIKFDESSANIYKIHAEIVIAKENHLPMVVGQKGQMIRRIGSSSRIELEKLLGKKVFLETHVKVKENWTRNPQMMKELGYVTHDEA